MSPRKPRSSSPGPKAPVVSDAAAGLAELVAWAVDRRTDLPVVVLDARPGRESLRSWKKGR